MLRKFRFLMSFCFYEDFKERNVMKAAIYSPQDIGLASPHSLANLAGGGSKADVPCPCFSFLLAC